MDEKFDIEYFIANEKGGMASFRDVSVMIRLLRFRDTYFKQIEPDFPDMVCTQVSYYGETLCVKEIGKYLKHGGIGIGVWKYYNEDGTLNHTVDMDEHFPITWDILEKIVKDKDISMFSADSIYRYYDEKKVTSTWSITIKLPMNKGCLYIFDGCTGELIEEEIIDLRKER